MKSRTNNAAPLPVLTISLGSQPYALDIEEVVEVASMVELASVPDSPPEMLGIANRHGAALPVFDMRRLFGQPAAPVDASTLFIVVRYEGQTAGLVVDEVHQVEYIQLGDVRPLPTAGKYIRDIVSHKGKLVQIIALPQLLSALMPEGIADNEVFEG